MLYIGETNRVKFDVNVMGTSIEPVVRVVLGTNPEMSFNAAKEHENSWMVNVVVPDTVALGDYDVRVEVLLNNRLFTPVKKKVTIGKKDLAADVPVKEMPKIETFTPKISEPIKNVTPFVPKIAEPVQPVKESGILRTQADKKPTVIRRAAAADEMKAIIGSISKIVPAPAKEVKITPAPTTSKLANICKAPIKPLKQRGKKNVQESKPVTLASIAADVRDQDKPVNAKAPSVTIKEHVTPIRLVKGDVIFEGEK